MITTNIYIPNSIKKAIANEIILFEKKHSSKNIKIDSQEYVSKIKAIIDNYQNINDIQRFNKFNPSNYKDIKYLEIASGMGFNLVNALKNNYDIVGIEPGDNSGFEGRYDICKDLIDSNNLLSHKDKIFNAVAEDLPFENKSFDFIFSLSALEHVDDIEISFIEANRVLKDGGIMYMNMPNYNSFFEVHYKVFWVPYIFMSKTIARFYLKLRKIDNSYIDELNFTSPYSINKIAKKTLKGTFKCYPHIDGFLSVFGLIYFAKNTNTMNTHKTIKTINKSKITSASAMLISTFIVNLYIFFGFARTFNFIYLKEDKNV